MVDSVSDSVVRSVPDEPSFLPEARGQAAQCWCDEANVSKQMDPDLAESVARRISGWMDTAAMFSRNADFYRGLVDQCAKHIGSAAYTADDGSVMDSPVRLKVPELTASLAEANSQLLDALQEAERYLSPRVQHTGGEGETRVLPIIRAALAKALGSQQ